jgi:hypothetical protein
MNEFLQTIAPTLASALLGPLGGIAVAGLGHILGIDNATTEKVTKAITDGRITPDQLAEIQKLELQYKNDEAERGFKYADLEFQDRDSARKANVAGNTQLPLFWLSLVLLSACLGMEGFVLFKGYPDDIPEIIVGRVLGLADAVVMMVMSYWYGTSSGSTHKTELLSQAPAVK